MKTKIATTVLSLVAIASSHAATLVFTNSNGFDTNAITDSNGVPYVGTGATASVGYFTVTDSELMNPASASTLTSAFQSFGGASTTFTLAGPPSQNNRGFFTLNAPATTIAGSAFEGKNMYIFVQNAAGTEFGVFKSSLVFSAADDPTLPNVTKTFTSANIPSANVLFGGTQFSALTNNNDTVANISWSTKAIPEPSAALVGALGALGLLRRRRN